MPERQFANQKALLAYAERNALVYAWERSPAFARRQRLLLLDDSEQYLRAREAEAMCDHVWIFEARTLSTQPVRRRCGMCGVYRMEPRCQEPGTSTCELRGLRVVPAGRHAKAASRRDVMVPSASFASRRSTAIFAGSGCRVGLAPTGKRCTTANY
jgi:hypothetical protein